MSYYDSSTDDGTPKVCGASRAAQPTEAPACAALRHNQASRRATPPTSANFTAFEYFEYAFILLRGASLDQPRGGK